MPQRFARISFRLPAIVIIAVALAAIIIGAFSYVESADEVRRQATNKLVSLRASRHAALSQYFRSIEEDLRLYAGDAMIGEALAAFGTIFLSLEPGERAREEQAFHRVFSASNAAGDLNLLQAEGTALTKRYHAVHAWHQPG